jgi:hypothetical protein
LQEVLAEPLQVVGGIDYLHPNLNWVIKIGFLRTKSRLAGFGKRQNRGIIQIQNTKSLFHQLSLLLHNMVGTSF